MMRATLLPIHLPGPMGCMWGCWLPPEVLSGTGFCLGLGSASCSMADPDGLRHGCLSQAVLSGPVSRPLSPLAYEPLEGRAKPWSTLDEPPVPSPDPSTWWGVTNVG